MEKEVSVNEWRNVIIEYANSNSAIVDPTVEKTEFKIGRHLAFNAVQVLLRGGLFETKYHRDTPLGNLRPASLKSLNEVTLPDAIIKFLSIINLINLKSIGIHIVDPIEGRISTIWVKPDNNEAATHISTLDKLELYSCAWNRIYRRLFRPSATLINAIESGVLPWRWNTIKLSTKHIDNHNLALFFKDSAELADILNKYINEFLPTESSVKESNHVEELSHIEGVFQKTWNKLEESAFTIRLKRISERFRDSILDDNDTKEIFYNYIKLCSVDHEPLDMIKSAKSDDTAYWSALLDAIEAIQSSVLSQTAFCDASGLWVHPVGFSNCPLLNDTSIYLIFGLTHESSPLIELDNEFIRSIKRSLDNLGIALGTLLENPITEFTKRSHLVDSLFDEIRKSAAKVKYHDDGLKRWLLAMDKLAKDAKHEGNAIKYNVGYGSLAYAHAHFHRFEAVPDELAKNDIPIENITSYIKGFYSIFGNHEKRGLWFDETGQYRGVFESSDDDFEKASSGRTARSQHQDTILFAKINGTGCFDIIQRNDNQIVRVKNGELTDMAEGDEKRRDAVKHLIAKEKIPSEFKDITNWLVNELVEVLQAKTHGTSFVVSFEKQASDENEGKSHEGKDSNWRSKIEMQVKTLVQHFSHLDAPLADWEQLTEYAKKWADLSKQQPHNSVQSYIRPKHLFASLAELANLDGGLWLRLKLTQDNKGGLWVRAAQQFIPLISMDDNKRPLDLQMKIEPVLIEENLPEEATGEITNFEALFAAINGKLVATKKRKEYIDALSFLHHSGTKTHSLWGLSLTAAEPCLCVVLSTDGNVYVFHDGREFTRLSLKATE